MSNTVIGASVEVEFKSVGDMRKAIKEATSDLIRMQEQFGKTSPQAIDAAKRIADLKDRIQDAKEQADLFDPGNKFKALSNAASQIAGGFAAVQGAMALVGTESEDLQKSLVKVQGALALSQGLSQIADLGKSFDELKVVAVNSFRAIKAAIGSTGIGLLVIALGAIVAYWDDIKEAVSGVSEEQKKLNEESKKNVDFQKEKLDSISAQDNILKLQGKSEKDILKLKIQQTDELIKASEIQLENTIATKKSQIEAAKRNKDILEGILKFISVPITAVLKGIDLIGSALGKNLNLEEKFFGGIASFVFDPKQVEEDVDKTIKEQKKAIETLKNNRAGFQLAISKIDQDAANKREEDKKKLDEEAKKKAEEEKKRLEELQKNTEAILIANGKRTSELRNQLRLAQITDEKEKAKVDTELKMQAELDSETQRYKSGEVRLEQYLINLALIRQRYAAEDKAKEEADAQAKLQKNSENLLKAADDEQLSFNERLTKIAEREAMESQIKFASEEERTAFEKANKDARVKIAQDEANAKIALTKSIGDALGALSDIVGKETAAGKALAIAQATINTFLGITEVWKAKSILPEPFNTATKIAATITTAAGGFAAVRNIVKTKVPGKSGGGGGSVPSISGGGGAPIQPVMSAAVQGQALNAQAINNMGNQSARAYVLNSDIQNNEQRNAYLQRNARIG